MKVVATFSGVSQYDNKSGETIDLYNFLVSPFYDQVQLTVRGLNGFEPEPGRQYILECSAFAYMASDGSYRGSLGYRVIGGKDRV